MRLHDRRHTRWCGLARLSQHPLADPEPEGPERPEEDLLGLYARHSLGLDDLYEIVWVGPWEQQEARKEATLQELLR